MSQLLEQAALDSGLRLEVGLDQLLERAELGAPAGDADRASGGHLDRDHRALPRAHARAHTLTRTRSHTYTYTHTRTLIHAHACERRFLCLPHSHAHALTYAHAQASARTPHPARCTALDPAHTRVSLPRRHKCLCTQVLAMRNAYLPRCRYLCPPRNRPRKYEYTWTLVRNTTLFRLVPRPPTCARVTRPYELMPEVHSTSRIQVPRPPYSGTYPQPIRARLPRSHVGRAGGPGADSSLEFQLFERNVPDLIIKCFGRMNVGKRHGGGGGACAVARRQAGAREGARGGGEGG
eukprot:5313298-Pleurochrysis_carterae.AAC.3